MRSTSSLLVTLTVWCYLATFCRGRLYKSRNRRRTLSRRRIVFPTKGGYEERRSIDNMTCDFIEQPLNHFSLPRTSTPSYMQRYCIYNHFVVNPDNATVFLYTGNESPLEEYINNTGLMWELAEEFNAQIVFVEHRYEGLSLPSPSISNCMAYSSSVQALADYASFLERSLLSSSKSELKLQKRPVIAFGGSYGGMLASWMRMKYPNLIAGSIAGSAPIWGFPSNFPNKIDAAFEVIQRGLELPYPPTESRQPTKIKNHCTLNLLATWPLIQYLASQEMGRKLVTDSFSLCSPFKEKGVDILLEWAQTPWFDMAEGSFPYPSSYIPYALTHKDNARLPAWPLQSACWKNSELYKDLGVQIQGNISAVRYDITYGTSGVTLQIDWDTVSRKGLPLPLFEGTTELSRLLVNVRDAISIWYNITKDVSCFDLTPAPNLYTAHGDNVRVVDSLGTLSQTERRMHIVSDDKDNNATVDCRDKIENWGSWPALCCNEEMELIITEAQGMGHDFLWPPSHPRGTKTHADVIDTETNLTGYCNDPNGYYGFPQDPVDRWSRWLDALYGGVRIASHSNIVFSNGMLDPWASAGVYKTDPTLNALPSSQLVMPGLYLQHINDLDLVALIMEHGGHHTDFMYSSALDPPSITRARTIEKNYIAKWVDEWWTSIDSQLDVSRKNLDL